LTLGKKLIRFRNLHVSVIEGGIMNPILWPNCECSPEFVRRIPEVLEREGYSVRRREVRTNPKGITPTFHYDVSDGLRRLAAIGVNHHTQPKVIVLFRPLRSGWRLHALFGREKFAMAVIESLVRHGAIKSPLPDEAQFRFLAESDDPVRARHAQMVLAALLREKKKKKA
jgi:hypothetical protein